MTPEELECLVCGAAVNKPVNKSDFRHRFRLAVKVLMIISAAMTVAAMFTDHAPPFLTSLIITLVLGLVKSSADQMLVDTDQS